MRARRYLTANLLGLLAVAFPPVRVVFRIRLVRSIFRRGSLGRFMLAASVVELNGAIITYLF